MYEVFSQQADELLKNKDYLKALNVLKTLWKSKKDVLVAEQILICVIELGYWREAEAWAKTFNRMFKDAESISALLKKLNTEKAINDTFRSKDLNSMIKEAEQTLSKLDDPIRKNDLLNSIIYQAKSKKEWTVAEEWLLKVDKAALEDNSPNKTISDLQKYYLNAQDVYLNLNKYQKLYEEMKAATEDYPDYFAFSKSYVLALNHLENYEEMNTFLEAKINWDRPKWFYVEQLALAKLKLGSKIDAWKLACRSFNTKIEQEHKVDLHLIMAEIAEQLEKTELAKDFRILTVLVRSEKNKEIPQDLYEHIQDADPNLTIDKIIAKHHDEILYGIHYGVPRYEGVITYFPPDRQYARLKYNKKKSALINKADLQEDCHYEGAKITFIEKLYVDKKSGKESVYGKLGRKLHKLDKSL